MKKVFLVILLVLFLTSCSQDKNQFLQHCNDIRNMMDRCQYPIFDNYPDIYTDCNALYRFAVKQEGSGVAFVSKLDGLCWVIDNAKREIEEKARTQTEREQIGPAQIEVIEIKRLQTTVGELYINPELRRYCKNETTSIWQFCKNNLMEFEISNINGTSINSMLVILRVTGQDSGLGEYLMVRFENLNISRGGHIIIPFTPPWRYYETNKKMLGLESSEDRPLNNKEDELLNVNLIIDGYDSFDNYIHQDLMYNYTLYGPQRKGNLLSMKDLAIVDLAFVNPTISENIDALLSYTPDTPAKKYNAAKDTWNLLSNTFRVHYIVQNDSNYIRPPLDVIYTSQGGDCDELVYTFASIYEGLGMKTEIINYGTDVKKFWGEGHALLRFNDGTRWYALETTLIGRASFDEALQRGEENYQQTLEQPNKIVLSPQEMWSQGFKEYNLVVWK